MAVMTIRNIDDAIKTRLRLRAARHGKSMEEEARDILRAALSTEPAQSHGLGHAIHERFAALGGVDLPEVPREPSREPVRDPRRSPRAWMLRPRGAERKPPLRRSMPDASAKWPSRDRHSPVLHPPEFVPKRAPSRNQR